MGVSNVWTFKGCGMIGIFWGNPYKNIEIECRISKLVEVKTKMIIFLNHEENKEVKRNIELAK